MTSLRCSLFTILTFLTFVTVSHTAVAQQVSSSSRSSSSSSSSSSASPQTCSRITNSGKLESADPNKSGALTGTLVRENCQNGCITGTLRVGDFECRTLELPWNNNLPNNSCIPANKTYACVRVNSPRFGNTFEISGVPGRTHILFHAGNFPKNTTGCVLLGMEVNGSNNLARSKEAVQKFLKELEGFNAFKITVIDKTGICSGNSSSSFAGR